MLRIGIAVIFAAGALSGMLLVQGCGGDSSTGSGTVFAAASPSPSPSPSSSLAISIPVGATGKGAAGYSPNPLNVAVGATVTWTNNDTMAHTVTADDGSYDSTAIQPGHTYSHTFTEAGTYPYYCTIHGKTSMYGTVVVQ